MAQDKEGDKLIPIACTVVVAPQHKKAFLAAFFDPETGDKLGERWLPYSRVKQRVRGAGGFTVMGEDTDAEIVAEIPQWLCETDGMDKLIGEQLLLQEDLGEDEYEEEDGDEDPYEDDIPF